MMAQQAQAQQQTAVPLKDRISDEIVNQEHTLDTLLSVFKFN